MLNEKLKEYQLYLGSKSPRRHQFMKDLGLEFEVLTADVEETYPEDLKGSAITDYLVVKKAEPLVQKLKEKDILITCDTIVCLGENALGKPKDSTEARQMLAMLSGKKHQVISSVAFTTTTQQIVVNDTTEVHFKEFSTEEMDYYIEKYKPYDKAGSYGIQEWLGFIGVTHIKGSYNNVMGLPTHLVYEVLGEMIFYQ